MDDSTKNFVNQVIGWVGGQGTKQKERTGVSGWMVGLGVGAVALIILAVMYYRAWLVGRKTAQLLHEKDVSEAAAAKAVSDAVIAKNRAEVVEHLRRVDVERARVKAADEALKTLDTEKRKALEEIDALKSWRDVDSYLSGGPGSR